MRLLVTGGAGFIGSAVTAAALDAGHDVLVLDRVAPAIPHPGATYLQGDVRDLDDALLRGVDAVSHQAAKVGLGVDLDDLPGYVADNDLGTAVLLAAMARCGVARLVLASSMVVYGEGGYCCPAHGPVHARPRAVDDLDAGRFEPLCPDCGASMLWTAVEEDRPLDPRNGYAASKVAQEHLAASWARATGGTAVALRYHNVYGPGLPSGTPYAGVAALFLDRLRCGCAPAVFEDGGQTRDFVHVRDVAEANALALAAGEPGALRPYNVASGRPHTVGELAWLLSRICDGPDPVVTGEYRLGDVRHVVASPARAARDLGFRAEVRLADGLAELAREPERAGA